MIPTPQSLEPKPKRLSGSLLPSVAIGLLHSALPAGLRFGGALLQFLATILIARGLGAEASGIYFFWAAAMMEAGQVATYGLDRIALRQVPRLADKPDAVTAFLAPLRTTALVFAIFLGLGLCGYAYFLQAEQGWPVWWYLLPILCTAGVAFSMINSEAMTGLSRPVLAIFYRHTVVVLVLIGVVLVSGAQLTVEITMAAYTAGFVFSGFGALFGPGFRGAGAPLALPSKKSFASHIAMGTPVFSSGLFASFAFLIPLSVLERTHPSEEIAYLTTAFRIFVLVDVLAKAIHSLAMPSLSLAGLEENSAELRRIYGLAIRRGLALLGIPILGIAVFAGPIMEIFGPSFVAGSDILRTFMGFALLSLLLGPAHQLLLMLGRTRSMALFSFVHLLFSGTLAILLVPRYGPTILAFVLGGGILLERILYLCHALRCARNQEGNPDSTAT